MIGTVADDAVMKELHPIPNEPGRPQVPGYILVETLPGGAGGEVYLARENRDRGLERVIKLFIPHPFADEQDPEPRFRSEVEAILRLQHKAIVRYVSSGVLDGPRPVFYLVMEFVKGSRLQTRATSMPFDVRVAAMIEILDGLEHAHSNSVFHRDIKPSNIMIRESDNQPVLVDFGLAYLVGDELDDDRTRTPLGTPGYIPPEVSNAPRKSRDPRHDVYQAGVTLYVVLAGRLPDPYIPLETTDASLRGLDPIVKRALAADPTARFPAAAAFATELRGWLEQQSRRRMLPPSPLTQRLRDRLLTKRAEHAQYQQAAETRAEAIRRGVRPIALTIEAAAIEAFREFHDAISDLLPFELDASELGPGDAPEDERDVKVSVRICALVHTTMNRSINFSRAHRDVDVWKVAIKQVPEYGALINDGRLQFPAWILWTTGSQSPKEIVKAVIYGLRKDPMDPESETNLVALHRRQSRTLNEPATIKNYLIEVLAAMLNLHNAT